MKTSTAKNDIWNGYWIFVFVFVFGYWIKSQKSYNIYHCEWLFLDFIFSLIPFSYKNKLKINWRHILASIHYHSHCHRRHRHRFQWMSERREQQRVEMMNWSWCSIGPEQSAFRSKNISSNISKTHRTRGKLFLCEWRKCKYVTI